MRLSLIKVSIKSHVLPSRGGNRWCQVGTTPRIQENWRAYSYELKVAVPFGCPLGDRFNEFGIEFHSGLAEREQS